MRVFVTGASGFVGSAVVKELLVNGHEVLGMVRSDDGAAAVAKLGATVHRGSLDDLESLKSGARDCDAVIHTAFNHDFSKFMANCEEDKRAIEALGSALVGSKRPLIVTSGTGGGTPGALRTEEDPLTPSSQIMPRKTEEAAIGLLAQGVNISVVRLPQVHDQQKQGLVTFAVGLAQEKGVVAYVGEGLNRWAAVPIITTAQLYRLVLEKGVAGARYHAVHEEGVTAKDIAEALGRRLKLPVVSKSPSEAQEHFGWLAMFASLDMPASSALTQERLGWQPTGPSLIQDLDYVNSVAV